MSITVHVAHIKDYNKYVPEIDVVRLCKRTDKIYSNKDICVINATVTDRNYINIMTKNDLIEFIQGKYFRQTFGCKFKVEIQYL